MIPESHADIFDRLPVAHLATSDAAGRPQCTPVWIEREGSLLRLNTGRDRKKTRNMRANASVALSIPDPADPLRYVGVQGVVVEIDERTGDAHNRALHERYTGSADTPASDEVRVVVTIEMRRVWTMG